MTYSKSDVIDYIWQYSRYYGNTLILCEKLNTSKWGYPALTMLFSIFEYASKSAVNDYDDKFCNILKSIKDKNYINVKEFDFLENIRRLRNRFAHANIMNINLREGGVLYPFTENETCLLLYEKLSLPLFNIILKIISHKLDVDFTFNIDALIDNSKIDLKILSIKELLAGKGFPENYLDGLNATDDEKMRLIENSSDVNILTHIFQDLYSD